MEVNGWSWWSGQNWVGGRNVGRPPEASVHHERRSITVMCGNHALFLNWLCAWYKGSNMLHGLSLKIKDDKFMFCIVWIDGSLSYVEKNSSKWGVRTNALSACVDGYLSMSMKMKLEGRSIRRTFVKVYMQMLIVTYKRGHCCDYCPFLLYLNSFFLPEMVAACMTWNFRTEIQEAVNMGWDSERFNRAE